MGVYFTSQQQQQVPTFVFGEVTAQQIEFGLVWPGFVINLDTRRLTACL